MTAKGFNTRRVFMAVGMSVVLITLSNARACLRPLRADEAAKPITADSELTAEEAKKALEALGKQIDSAERSLQKLRDEFGPGSPPVVQAERELEGNRELLPLYKELISRLAGLRGEKKLAEDHAIAKKLAAAAGKLEQSDQLKEAANQKGMVTPQIAVMQHELAAMKRALETREAALAEANKELAKLERASDMPPIESGDLKVYSLLSLPAKDAADAIETLFGPRAMRVAVDNRTNSLIVFGKADSLPVIEALLMRLDQKASPPKVAAPSGDDASRGSRSILLRLFWLADGLPAEAGSDPFEVLPESVLRATDKLGLVNPRLITQSVNALAASSGEGVEFSSDVPALLGRQSVRLTTGGKVTLVAPDQVALAMHAYTTGKNQNCELRGSLSVPLGHYMVLGTANSVIPKVAEGQTNDELKLDPGTGTLVQIPESADVQTDDPEYTTSRFAFVVQVIDAESFPPEKR